MFDSGQNYTDSCIAVHVLEHGLPLNNGEEFRGLILASGVDELEFLTANVRRIDPRLFIGLGKSEELADLVSQHNPDVVIVNAGLTPSQERNLEKQVKCRVIDRTRLILDIFAQRARSHEGKLQVELAQLDYISTRLVRGWTHLERQRGGIGLRGPGETQLESDRRMLAARVSNLKEQLKKVNKRRLISQNARNTPIVALAGYTNAGKSSLFNKLCYDQQYVADQLFASLDTTLRRISLPGTRQAVLVDTVGFVQNLPHQLIDAFSSTLQEVLQANLVVHVCDASDSRLHDKISDVNHVLREIGASKIQRLVVWNKSDMLSKEQIRQLPQNIAIDDKQVPCVAISVESGEGIENFLESIARCLNNDRINGWFQLLPKYASRNRAFLYKINAVKEEYNDKQGYLFLHLDVEAGIVRSLQGVKKIDSSPLSSSTNHLLMAKESSVGSEKQM